LDETKLLRLTADGWELRRSDDHRRLLGRLTGSSPPITLMIAPNRVDETDANGWVRVDHTHDIIDADSDGGGRFVVVKYGGDENTLEVHQVRPGNGVPSEPVTIEVNAGNECRIIKATEDFVILNELESVPGDDYGGLCQRAVWFLGFTSNTWCELGRTDGACVVPFDDGRSLVLLNDNMRDRFKPLKPFSPIVLTAWLRFPGCGSRRNRSSPSRLVMGTNCSESGRSPEKREESTLLTSTCSGSTSATQRFGRNVW
jgi:hypothetical protein